MPDKAMKKLRLAILLGAAVNLAGTGVFVYSSTEARKKNCQNVSEAFDAYTEALADVAGADADTVADFRAAYEPRLRDCH